MPDKNLKDFVLKLAASASKAQKVLFMVTGGLLCITGAFILLSSFSNPNFFSRINVRKLNADVYFGSTYYGNNYNGESYSENIFFGNNGEMSNATSSTTTGPLTNPSMVSNNFSHAETSQIASNLSVANSSVSTNTNKVNFIEQIIQNIKNFFFPSGSQIAVCKTSISSAGNSKSGGNQNSEPQYQVNQSIPKLLSWTTKPPSYILAIPGQTFWPNSKHIVTV